MKALPRSAGAAGITLDHCEEAGQLDCQVHRVMCMAYILDGLLDTLFRRTPHEDSLQTVTLARLDRTLIDFARAELTSLATDASDAASVLNDTLASSRQAA